MAELPLYSVLVRDRFLVGHTFKSSDGEISPLHGATFVVDAILTGPELAKVLLFTCVIFLIVDRIGPLLTSFLQNSFWELPYRSINIKISTLSRSFPDETPPWRQWRMLFGMIWPRG